MENRVAIMVDGDNISPVHAARILREATGHGQLVLARTYGDMSGNSCWHKAVEFHPVHTGRGKNATDLLMAIDAVEFALTDVFDAIVIATSDDRLLHLARRLSEYGKGVHGLGDARTSMRLREIFSTFRQLPE